MFKFLKRTLFVCILIILFLTVFNAETDYMRNFKSYCPEFSEAFPKAADVIENTSQLLSRSTNYLTFEKILAKITNEEEPVDPDDIAVNTYYEDDKHLNFYKDDYTAVILGVDWVNVCGVTNDEKVKSLAVTLKNTDGENVVQEIGNKEKENKYSILAKIPSELKNRAEVVIYTGEQRYGQYESIVNEYVYITEDENGNWSFEQSPVYEHNKQMYEKNKSIRNALKSTRHITSDSEIISEFVQELTAKCETDYEKLVLIHDWICENLYYDKDILEIYDTPAADEYPFMAEDVITGKKAVCRGFAYTFAAMARAAKIPCNIVSGYALGIDGAKEWTEEALTTEEPNHAWNEAYADGRWIIIDSTWDCKNKFENGKETEGNMNHIFFDSNIRFFSQNHRIMKYIYE